MSRDLVARATSEDSKDPSGFVLKELTALTLQSIQECEEIQAQLLKRLQKDSPDIKFKALRCLKHLSIHGRADFRLSLSRSSSEIKAAGNFRAPPDPLRGDAPSKRVQEEAKECLNALFNGSSSSQKSSEVSGSGRIQGFGGFGGAAEQPKTSPQQTPPSFTSGSSLRLDAFGSSSNVVKGGSARVERPNPQFAASHGNSFVPPTAVEGAASNRQRGQVGGIWASDTGTSYLANSSAAPPQRNAAPQAAATARPAVRSNGEYEGKLVDSITPPTGVRATPSPEELKAFLQKCDSLDKSLVAGLLNARLQPGAWQSQMKSLCVLEALLQQNNSEEVEDYLCDNSAELEELEINGANAQVRSKATRILELCGIREEKKNPPAAMPAVRPAQAQAQPIDLMGFAAAPAPSEDFLSTASASSGASAFSFMGSEQQQTTTSSINLFSDLELKQTVAAEPAALSSFSQMAVASADPLDFLSAADPLAPLNNKKIDPVTALLNAKPPSQASQAPLNFPQNSSPFPQNSQPPRFSNPNNLFNNFPQGFPTQPQQQMPAFQHYQNNGGLSMQAPMPGMQAPFNPLFPAGPQAFQGYGGYQNAPPPQPAHANVNFKVSQMQPKNSAFDAFAQPPAAPVPSAAPSGFGFIGAGSSGDSFNFVSDLMATQGK